VEALAARRVVWDLLPGDHADAVRLAPGRSRHRVRVERAGRVVSYDSKAVKGALARHILVSGDSSVAGLRAFTSRGYALGGDEGGLVRMVAT
jgi:hypothetical protein